MLPVLEDDFTIGTAIAVASESVLLLLPALEIADVVFLTLLGISGSRNGLDGLSRSALITNLFSTIRR